MFSNTPKKVVFFKKTTGKVNSVEALSFSFFFIKSNMDIYFKLEKRDFQIQFLRKGNILE
jgi:hypothetical protein